MFSRGNCKLIQTGLSGFIRQIHSRHFPNEVVTVKHPKAKDFDDLKKTGPEDWPFYGGRIEVKRKQRPRFPQIIPQVDTTPIDIRLRQVDRTMRFGSNPRTYPTMLVYADGTTVTIPYHKPVGTIYLPGEGTQISLGVKKKAKVKRRVKIGL
ncbi:hypothetical protein ACHWQZ_G004879 [Mnemiopsis leidyi]